MVNVLLHRCCAAQINLSSKLVRGAVVKPFVKDSIHAHIYCIMDMIFVGWQPAKAMAVRLHVPQSMIGSSKSNVC